ncbi:chemotaxis protein CheX [Cellulomonas endophytica]|uniref:chemotaxis protein CheX n=1 Tax=Cellulomonas endophytica TaxID=2494735 RepID=UPI0010126F33|nr:chemotaxis protein CheX [Cellulomonas endophytica]
MTVTTVDTDQVLAIAEAVFSAMVDGDAGLLLPWYGELPEAVEPLCAWVDLHGEVAGRAALVCELDTAHELARALLMMGPQEPIGESDLVDAFGEIANVVGGNIKSLLPVQGSLGLPQVALGTAPAVDAPVAEELRLSWRGQPIVISIWLVA